MSGIRETAACYRLYAANCLELAERADEIERRVFLLHMARDWLKLAAQIEQSPPEGSDTGGEC
jgi:hypothetical protein